MDNKIEFIKEDGTVEECEVLFTHHSDEFQKDYIVFIPAGTENIVAATYVSNEDGDGHLEQIESEEEWALIEELLDSFFDELDEGCSCGEEDCDCGDEDCDCEGEGCNEDGGHCCGK